jgi:shikimate 5-dehydrogenase
MKPNVDGTPLPEHLVRPGTVIFDTVYNPLATRLLREANKRGARAVDGIGMFVEQAAQQIRIWTGQRAWPRLMREAALERLGGK